MIKTICQIADVHFRNIKRRLEYKAVIDNLIYKLSESKPDRLVICGDLVHSRNVLSPELVDDVSEFLIEVSKHCGKVIIIPGNHDIVEQNKSRMDAITPIIKTLNKLNINNVIYYKDSGLYEDENVIWVVYSLNQDNRKPDNLDIKPFENKVYIGLYHGKLIGATNDIGYVFRHGAEADLFNGCDVVLCGDIHKRQVLDINGINAIMCGSLIQQNFGERVSTHGYCMLDISKDIKYEFFDIENPIKYLKFKITDIQDIFDEKEELINL